MNQLVFLLGLPGTGKTILGKGLEQTMKNCKTIFCSQILLNFLKRKKIKKKLNCFLRKKDSNYPGWILTKLIIPHVLHLRRQGIKTIILEGIPRDSTGYWFWEKIIGKKFFIFLYANYDILQKRLKKTVRKRCKKCFLSYEKSDFCPSCNSKEHQERNSLKSHLNVQIEEYLRVLGKDSTMINEAEKLGKWIFFDTSFLNEEELINNIIKIINQ